MRFLRSIARYLQFILAPDPVEHSLSEDSYGDRPALPFVCTQGCNCNPVLPGLASPFAGPVDCAGGPEASGALVDCGGVPTPPVLSTFHAPGDKL